MCFIFFEGKYFIGFILLMEQGFKKGFRKQKAINDKSLIDNIFFLAIKLFRRGEKHRKMGN